MQNTTDTTGERRVRRRSTAAGRRPQSLDFRCGSARSAGGGVGLAPHRPRQPDLRQCARILQKVGPVPHVHGEMMLNTIRLVSRAQDRGRDCVEGYRRAGQINRRDPLRADLASAGTHPFADPLVQKVTNAGATRPAAPGAGAVAHLRLPCTSASGTPGKVTTDPQGYSRLPPTCSA